MIFALQTQQMHQYAEKSEPSSAWIFSQFKLKKIAIGFFSLMAILVGSSFIFHAFTTAIIQTAFFAVPFFGAAGYALWILFRSTDYDDALKLATFRNTAKQNLLPETVKTHGWEKIFYYGIPLPEDFAKIYSETIRNMSLKDALDFCDETLKAYQAYGTPEGYRISASSDLREKWKIEKQKPLCFLLEIYDLEKLERLGVVTQDMTEYQRLLDAKNEFDFILKEFTEQTLEIKQNFFQTNLAHLLQKLKIALKSQEKNFLDTEQTKEIQDLLWEIDFLTPDNFFHICLRMLPFQFSDPMLKLDEKKYSKCPFILEKIKSFHKELQSPWKEYRKALKVWEKWKEDKYEKINKKYPLV